MNSVVKYTANLKPTDTEAWQELKTFINNALMTVACCLRLKRAVQPFLKDPKKYVFCILTVFKQFAADPDIISKCLTLFKLFLHDETCTKITLT